MLCGFLLAAVLAAGCTSKSTSSGTVSEASSPAAAPSGSGSQANATQPQAQPETLDGVKNRVPIYDSNTTAKPSTVTSGMYQFETSDTPKQVVAWCKAHIPAAVPGKWREPDPDAAPEWGFTGNVSDGAFSITIEPVNPGYKGYAAGSKTIVAVLDR